MRDRPDVIAAEESREYALGHLPIRQHVRDTAGHAQVVLEHHEAAVLETNQVGAGNRDVDVLMDLHTSHLAPIVPAAVDELRWDNAFGEDASLVVDVLEEQVDRGQPLSQAAFERIPLTTCQDPGQQVERENPLRALIVSIDGERNALCQERAVGFQLPLSQLLW